MKTALKMALKGLGKTTPNPAVGAVIVRDGCVIASGYHKMAGAAHAEVDAISNLKVKTSPRDVLYVTLEPCNHYGKTPPCTKAILDSGIKNVVVGMKDPNPGVKGGGIEFLEKNGVNVKTGVLEKECMELLESFTKFVKTGRPFVIAKSALTLDGFTATSTGHSMWVTGEVARRYVHRLRSRVDAVMVGVGTVIADNPLLTSRFAGKNSRNPHRIIVDTHLKIPPDSRLLNDDADVRNYIVTGKKVSGEKIKRVERSNTSVIRCPVKDNHIDLTALMDIIGQINITSILLEGGAALMGSMLRERLIDKFLIFKAPKLLGGSDGMPMATGKGPLSMNDTLNLDRIKTRMIGPDILISGYPVY
jgi:diaminohydroxyphosphoribosylaminopyrimidine deaminase / 5-amino-6-(5-phosphoribosylamino)uracil reductase